MADFPTQVRAEPRTGTEGRDEARASAIRDADVWKLAQLAATIYAGRCSAGQEPQAHIAVNDAASILAWARERVDQKP